VPICILRVTDGCSPSLIRCHAPLVARCRLVHLFLVEADHEVAPSVPTRLLSQVPDEFVREFIRVDGRLESPPMTHGLDPDVYTIGRGAQFAFGGPVMNRRAEAVARAMAAADVISPTGSQVGQEAIVLAQTQVAAPHAQLASLQAIHRTTQTHDTAEQSRADRVELHSSRSHIDQPTAQFDAAKGQCVSDIEAARDRHVAECRAVEERHAKELTAEAERHAKDIADLKEAAANDISPAAESLLATLRATLLTQRRELVGFHSARVQIGDLTAQLDAANAQLDAVKAKCASDFETYRRELCLFTHHFIADKLESGRSQCVSRCMAANEVLVSALKVAEDELKTAKVALSVELARLAAERLASEERRAQYIANAEETASGVAAAHECALAVLQAQLADKAAKCAAAVKEGQLLVEQRDTALECVASLSKELDNERGAHRLVKGVVANVESEWRRVVALLSVEEGRHARELTLIREAADKQAKSLREEASKEMDSERRGADARLKAEQERHALELAFDQGAHEKGLGFRV
jgi:hypothetical protein